MSISWYFFFSSRRRHTRCLSDWSSDVCSSDLAGARMPRRRTMLEGCVAWPADLAARYRARGWWEGITIAEMLARSAARHPEKTALVCANQRLSYRDIVETSDRLACRFLDAGIEPLDRVVVQLPNGPEFVHTYFALTRIGAIPVTALRAHRHTEIRHFVRASGAIAYVIPDRIGGFDYRTMAVEIQSDFRDLLTVFVV